MACSPFDPGEQFFKVNVCTCSPTPKIPLTELCRFYDDNSSTGN